MVGDRGLDLTSKTGEHRLQVGGDALTGKLDDGLLLRPQLGKLQGGAIDALQLVVVHDIASQRLLIGTNALDVDTYGLVADHTDGSLATMAEVEVDVGMANDAGLAVFTIFEDGSLIDAILLAQGLAQQQIGSRNADTVPCAVQTAGAMPPASRSVLCRHLYIYSYFTVHSSLFTVHCSLFTVHYSLFTSAALYLRFWPVDQIELLGGTCKGGIEPVQIVGREHVVSHITLVDIDMCPLSTLRLVTGGGIGVFHLQGFSAFMRSGLRGMSA